jgi:hypothetical protein
MYEIVVSIVNGVIVWINSPFVRGLFNDLQFLCVRLKQHPEDKEQAEVGDNPSHIKTRSIQLD